MRRRFVVKASQAWSNLVTPVKTSVFSSIGFSDTVTVAAANNARFYRLHQ
jgi:hypothetical protein